MDADTESLKWERFNSNFQQEINSCIECSGHSSEGFDGIVQNIAQIAFEDGLRVANTNDLAVYQLQARLKQATESMEWFYQEAKDRLRAMWELEDKVKQLEAKLTGNSQQG